MSTDIPPSEWLRDLLDHLGSGRVGRLRQCPAHDDPTPSLSLRDMQDGWAGVKCFAGCSTDEVLESLRLPRSAMARSASETPEAHAERTRLNIDFPPVERPSHSGGDQWLPMDGWHREAIHNYGASHRALRFRHESGRKRIVWQTQVDYGEWESGLNGLPMTDLPLYEQHRVLAAITSDAPVHLVESESSVDALIAAGFHATTWAGGASSPPLSRLGSTLTGAHVVLIPDNDEAGIKCARSIADALAPVVASLRVAWPDTGQDARDLLATDPARITDTQPIDKEHPMPTGVTDHKAMSLDEAHAVFRRWLGPDYDLDALNSVLAATAVERLDGDPVWLLLLSGSGNAKTETVSALAGAGASVTSSIASEGALLSATSHAERTKDATGGLLRRMGDRGVLVVKDVTTILSMNRDMRASVLAAMREVYDGRWERNVGTDGGRTLTWEGRIVVVGAVTSAWDDAHAVISAMGDRFALVRMDSNVGRLAAGRLAISNTGHEEVMRRELAEAVGAVIAGMDTTAVVLTDEESNRLLVAADLVTKARTSVTFDLKGSVADAHAPEMPTRFARQLTQILRGGVAIGMPRDEALRLALRVARDSMPPMRLSVIDDLAEHPDSTPTDVRKRIGKPWTTVDRQLQALHMLGVVTVDEVQDTFMNKPRTRWHYSLAEDIDPSTLVVPSSPEMSAGRHTQASPSPDMSVGGHTQSSSLGGWGGSDKSGDGTWSDDEDDEDDEGEDEHTDHLPDFDSEPEHLGCRACGRTFPDPRANPLCDFCRGLLVA